MVSTPLPRPTFHLYVLGDGGASELFLAVPAGSSLPVQLDPRHTQLLLKAQSIEEDDLKQGFEPRMAGWRTMKGLAEALVFEVPTVKAYRSQINARIKAAAAALGVPAPVLWEVRRSGGVRLAGTLRVIRLP